MVYYVTCSLHPHPNLAQNSISASDPLTETVKQRLTATVFLNLDTAFSTLQVVHLYKLHKFLHFTWSKPDSCIFTHGHIRHPLNQPHRPGMAYEAWSGLVWTSISHTLWPFTIMTIVYCRQTVTHTWAKGQWKDRDSINYTTSSFSYILIYNYMKIST